MLKGTATRWQTNFFTGLAVIMPIVITLALVVWLFGTVSNITDTLLFFLPKRWTHTNGGTGPVQWNWSLLALLVTFLGIGMVGRLTRYYVGRKAFQIVDHILLSIPMLNKIYSTIKQVNDAFSSNKKSSFQQVVLVEFPRAGLFSVGFVTSERNQDMERSTGEEVVSVFVPTTPNPTTGFLILVPEKKLTRLDISVAEGIKFIISLGSVHPEHAPTTNLGPPADLSGAQGAAAGATEFITEAVRAGSPPATTQSTPSGPLPTAARAPATPSPRP